METVRALAIFISNLVAIFFLIKLFLQWRRIEEKLDISIETSNMLLNAMNSAPNQREMSKPAENSLHRGPVGGGPKHTPKVNDGYREVQIERENHRKRTPLP